MSEPLALELLRQPERFLRGSRLPRNDAVAIVRGLQALREDPRPPRSRQLVDVVHEGQPVRRLRVGDYRILYVPLPSQGRLVVVRIDHRRDVYRDF